MASQAWQDWSDLLSWLEKRGMRSDVSVEPRDREGAGRGLYATTSLAPSSPFLRIPECALLNSRTLRSIYPSVNLEGYEKVKEGGITLDGTQMITIHLCLHRPDASGRSLDVNFGPYISTLPEQFDSHPLTWLMKKEQNLATTAELSLLNCCPPGVILDLKNVAARFKRDWESALRCKKDYPQIFRDQRRNENLTLMNFLWAWLNVNTRCLYHRIFSKHLPLSNLTLCPIIDLANHSTSPVCPRACPQEVAKDIWANLSDSVVEPHDFVFLSPDRPVKSGEELFLKYGSHSSRTLFTEYGFVDWTADASGGEVDVSNCIDVILAGKPAQERLRRLLDEEDYIGNWFMYSSPHPAHPSWRFLVALRLANLDLSEEATSEEIDGRIRSWRAVAMGETEIISDENERATRQDLEALCGWLVMRAEKGLKDLVDQHQQNPSECGTPWYSWAMGNIKRLWEEERSVAQEVLRTLSTGTDF